MKKLLIALLTLTLIFTSCTMPANPDDASSLNKYAQSQEALDLVKRVATYLADINFSSITFNDREEVLNLYHTT